MMKVYKINEGISFSFPSNWLVEHDNNLISVFDPQNGVGALQFSIYEIKDTNSINLVEKLSDYLEEKHGAVSVKLFIDYSYSDLTDEDGVYWRYWLFSKKNRIIFVSYNCAQEDIGQEDTEIMQIIKSLN